MNGNVVLYHRVTQTLQLTAAWLLVTQCILSRCLIVQVFKSSNLNFYIQTQWSKKECTMLHSRIDNLCTKPMLSQLYFIYFVSQGC